MFRNNLADIYVKQGKYELARQFSESALQYWGDKRFVQLPFNGYAAYVGLGALAFQACRQAESKEYLGKALEIYPQGDYAHLYLGAVYMQCENNYPEAIRHFEMAIKLDPLNETARDFMGAALFNQGKITEASRFFSEALRINPGYKNAQVHLDMVHRVLER